MNSRRILSLLAFMLSALLHSDIQACDPWDGLLVEFRASYFRPASSELRELFDDGGCNYQLTGALPIYSGECEWARGINLWTAVDYFSKNGKSAGLNDKTSIRIVPLTLGVKYFLPCMACPLPFNFYAAAGMKYYFVHNRNYSDFVRPTINRSGMGGVVEAGVIAAILDHIVLDLFVSYSIKSFDALSNSSPSVVNTGLNVGGLNIGAGLGYQF